ncbi:uncharacterized protein JCM15063_004118 [Sporobolomyces koalae]|uniref:uncharacterized protein n=1 Tax=Sporobolomyces koalae TaxID=500713 RepID=UPI0031745DA8
MVTFPLSTKFGFSGSSSAPSSTISSRSRVNHQRVPSSPAAKSLPTTALSILSDFSNTSDSFPLARRPTKRPKTSEGYVSFSDLLSIPPCVLDKELQKCEDEREQMERDRREGRSVAAETPWTAPPTPDSYFLPYRPIRGHARSSSDPTPLTGTQDDSSPRLSPTRPSFNRTLTDPGFVLPTSELVRT